MPLRVREAASELAWINFQIAGLRLRRALKAGFNPIQPRVPAGDPTGGQWTDSGATYTLVPIHASGLPPLSGVAAQRRVAILRGSGSIFSVAANPNADSSAPWYENPRDSDVARFDAEIRAAAQALHFNPDLIRAIMYVETTHGSYFGLGPLTDALGVSGSILPMNVRLATWGEAFGSRQELSVPLRNIYAGGRILAGIIANLPPSASVAQVATLYNSLFATRVSDYGARVEAVLRLQLWEQH